MRLNNYNVKKGKLMKKENNSERHNARAPVKLPNLKSAYLEHPSKGLNFNIKM